MIDVTARLAISAVDDATVDAFWAAMNVVATELSGIHVQINETSREAA